MRRALASDALLKREIGRLGVAAIAMNDAEVRRPMKEHAVASGSARQHCPGIVGQVVAGNQGWVPAVRFAEGRQAPGRQRFVQRTEDRHLNRDVPVRRAADTGMSTAVIRVKTQGEHAHA